MWMVSIWELTVGFMNPSCLLKEQFLVEMCIRDSPIGVKGMLLGEIFVDYLLPTKSTLLRSLIKAQLSLEPGNRRN